MFIQTPSNVSVGQDNVFSVDKEDSAPEKSIQNRDDEYDPNSGVHGMVFDYLEEFYSADMHANCIWTHKKDMLTGYLSVVGKVDAPQPGDHPKWVEIHPNGQYLYVVNEAGNTLALYLIDPRTHLPVYTYAPYSLIPPGKPFYLTL